MTRRWWCRLGALGALAALVLGPAPAASAHPLGNFSVNHYTGLLVAEEHALAEHIVDLAEIPTRQLGARLDDLDRLAAEQCGTVAAGLRLEVRDLATKLEVTAASASTGAGEAGLPITRVTCQLRADYPAIDGPTAVTLRDRVGAGQVGWREITARGDGTTLTESNVPQTSISDRLADYPADLLESPRDVRSATLTVEPGGPAGALEGSAAGLAGPGGAPTAVEWADRLTEPVAGMLDRVGVGWLLLAVAGAVGLGAVHALAPGHGKTLVALYLAGGQTRSFLAALRVGLTVTTAHTASVLLLGLVVAGGAAALPARVYPILTAVSGLLVLWLGIGLVRRARRPHDHPHSHSHGGAGHAHGDPHVHDGHPHPHAHGAGHAHDGHPHRPSYRRGGLVALGIAGGVVPSPAALLLLFAAVSLGKAWLGALLVGAFGVGMALTLCAVGLLAADVLARVEARIAGRTRWARTMRLAVAYGGAAGVCVIGAGLMLRSALVL